MTQRPRIVALEYHDVIAGNDADRSGLTGDAAASYKLTTENFERHVAALAAAPVRVVPIVDVGSPHGTGDARVVLTFDDGGASASEHIAPLLEARGFRGAFFITTDRIDTAGFLTSPQIVNLHRRGHIIGSHSCSHPTRMAACSASELAHEWGDSIKRLCEILGAVVTTASVPGGYFSRAVAHAAAAAGVHTLFTSEPTTSIAHVGDCAVIGRYTLRRNDPAEYVAALVAASSSTRRRQWLMWNAKKVAKVLGGRAYLQLREVVFKAERS
jgi:peptidoglycan/xylan/chitin deacetylase (PgdA/CDA1 family)